MILLQGSIFLHHLCRNSGEIGFPHLGQIKERGEPTTRQYYILYITLSPLEFDDSSCLS